MAKVFEEKPFREALKAYEDANKNRFFNQGHSVLMLVGFEVLFAISRTPQVTAYNGVDAWFKTLLTVVQFGTLPISIVIICISGRFMLYDWMGWRTKKERKAEKEKKKKDKKYESKRKKKYRPNWYYFFFMMVEGFVYAIVLRALIPGITFVLTFVSTPHFRFTFSLDEVDSTRHLLSNPLQDLALSLGAGFYEEYLFRGALFGLLVMLAKQNKRFKRFAAETDTVTGMFLTFPKFKWGNPQFNSIIIFATLIYALSASLPFPPFADSLTLYNLLYRFLFGIAMYAILVYRKFAVAIWTHAFYDLWYFLLV